MDEPAPPPGFLARAAEYADAATIPRLLFLRDREGRERTVRVGTLDSGDRLPRHHRAVGRGRSQAADVLEDLGWFVVDNLPTSLIAKVARAGAGAGLDASSASPSSSGSGRTQAELHRADRAAAAGRPPGAHPVPRRQRPTRWSAATSSTRRRHPLRRRRAAGSRPSSASARCSSRSRRRPTSSSTRPTSTSTSCETADRRPVRRRGADSGHADRRSCRSASSTACRSTSTSCSTAASCRTRTGSTSCDRSPASTSRSATTCSHQPATEQFLERLDDLLDLLLPAYVARGQELPPIAFGCTGGRHRSVAIAEEVASRLRAGGRDASGRAPRSGQDMTPRRRNIGTLAWWRSEAVTASPATLQAVRRYAVGHHGGRVGRRRRWIEWPAP